MEDFKFLRMWRVMGKGEGEGITKESPWRLFSHETETLHSIKTLTMILGLSLELELDFRDPFLRWLFGVSTKDKGAPGSLELEEARFASLLWCIGDRRALGHFYDVRQLDCTFAAAVARRIIISDLNKQNVHFVINCYGYALLENRNVNASWITWWRPSSRTNHRSFQPLILKLA